MAPGRRPRRPFAYAGRPTQTAFRRLRVGLAATATAVAGMAVVSTAAPHAVHADATFDQVLFGLINQDRAAAGLPALRWNSQLSTIGESAPYGGCGFTVAGRAQDMIQRNYFSHTICGSQNVFNVMAADGVHYSSAGENIGWESGVTDPTAAAQYLNTEYMNSPEHKANILNPTFTDVGVGSWSTAPGQGWTGCGCGSSFQNVVMSSEEFAGFSTTAPATATAPTVVGGSGPGYWEVGRDGGVFDFAASGYYGSMGGHALARPVVSAAATPDHNGYWMVAADGGIFTFGDAGFHGSTGAMRLNRPIVGMASTPSGNGYWLVASDGGIFTFGDAGFHGSTGALRLNKPIVGMAATPSGNGYWLVASDGGIFAFGDARFHGSTGALHLVSPVVGMAATPSGNGYWLVASDGGIFTFGDAGFHGSIGGHPLAQPVTGMARTPDGGGYWLVARDGGVFAFGDAPFHGSTGNIRLGAPMVSLIS